MPFSVDDPGGGEKCVAPFVHGSRARVVRRSVDSDVPALDTDDSLDDADVDAAPVEDRSLLDVKLEKSEDRARLSPRLVDASRIASKE
jgi:hypothetical protein